MALASNVVQKRCAYVNEEQKNLLLEFMRKHPELQSGKFSATFTFKHAQKLWEGITDELHQIPGAVKNWKQWRKTWQDIRSSTKAKNASIKNHAKQTGGGPVSNQVLTEMDQNVLALIGSAAVDGHKTVQESNVQFEWLEDSNVHNTDDSNVCNIDNGEDEETFPVIYNHKITQNPTSQNLFLPPQNHHGNVLNQSEENYPSEESLNNNCDYYNNNNKNSSTNIKATEAQMAITATTNNTSHISVIPISNSVSKKGVKRTAAQRYDKSIEQTEKLTTISQKDYEIRQSYYAKKLKLYEKKLDLKERDVIAKENMCTLLEQFKKKQLKTDRL